jgi:PTS system mannose-specific IIA component
MVGIVVVAHGKLAEALIETAEMIVGHFEGVKACSFCQGSDVEKLRKMLKTSIKDMFGGTPSNISLSFQDEKLEVITGVNLPMLICAVTKREGRQIQELTHLLKDTGCSNIYIASEVLATNLLRK